MRTDISSHLTTVLASALHLKCNTTSNSFCACSSPTAGFSCEIRVAKSLSPGWEQRSARAAGQTPAQQSNGCGRRDPGPARASPYAGRAAATGYPLFQPLPVTSTRGPTQQTVNLHPGRPEIHSWAQRAALPLLSIGKYQLRTPKQVFSARFKRLQQMGPDTLDTLNRV